MLLTEQEAAEKWCPHARVLLPINVVGNKVSRASRELVEKVGDEKERAWIVGQIEDCKCVGSKCSQWRWYESALVKLSYGNLIRENRRGFCGLAGVPTEK